MMIEHIYVAAGLFLVGTVTALFWVSRSIRIQAQVDKQNANGELRSLFVQIQDEEEGRDINRFKIEQKKEEIKKIRENHNKLENATTSLQKIRPLFAEAFYSIGVLGMQATGKTQLVNRLTNHYHEYVDSTLSSTGHKDPELTRSVRTSAHEGDNRRLAEYLRFECYAGEAIKDAITNLNRLCYARPGPAGDGLIPGIHGLIIVVDLAETRKENDQVVHRYSQERIERNLQEFSEPVVRLLFQQPITDKLKVVILFVNKSDMITSPLEELGSAAQRWYGSLIASIRQCYGEPLVIIGSVKQDIGLTHLFATLVQNIFRKEGATSPDMARPWEEASERNSAPDSSDLARGTFPAAQGGEDEQELLAEGPDHDDAR